MPLRTLKGLCHVAPKQAQFAPCQRQPYAPHDGAKARSSLHGENDSTIGKRSPRGMKKPFFVAWASSSSLSLRAEGRPCRRFGHNGRFAAITAPRARRPCYRVNAYDGGRHGSNMLDTVFRQIPECRTRCASSMPYLTPIHSSPIHPADTERMPRCSTLFK